jgi:hypothetical protein
VCKSHLEENTRRGLLAADWNVIERVTMSWDIGTPGLFASATLMRPVRYGKKNGGGPVEQLNQYEQSMQMKAKLKSFLLHTNKKHEVSASQCGKCDRWLTDMRIRIVQVGAPWF